MLDKETEQRGLPGKPDEHMRLAYQLHQTKPEETLQVHKTTEGQTGRGTFGE